MKKSIITIVAFMLLALVGFAQEKYDYMIISSEVGTIHITTKEKDEDIGLTRGENILVTLLKKVDEMQDKGWEVYNSNPYSTGRYLQVYYLRKKKQ